MRISSQIAILLFCAVFLTPLFLQPAAADPGDIITPGTSMVGTLDEDNPYDYYGLQIPEPGFYNFSVYSTGHAFLEASLLYYSRGQPYWYSWQNANGSSIVEIFPGPFGTERNYQIRISSYNVEEEASYVVEFYRLHDLDRIASGQTKTAEIVPLEGLWYIFEADGTTDFYNFSINSSNPVHIDWGIFDKYGLFVTSGYYTGNRTWVVNLQHGEYYVKLENWGFIETTVRARFDPAPLSLIVPGESVDLHLNHSVPSLAAHYYQLSLQEGVCYDIELNMQSTVNGWFEIFKGPSTSSPSIAVSDFGMGESENISDLVFWGHNSIHTCWDWNLTYDREKTGNVFHTYWDGEYVNHSNLILGVYCFAGDGDATISVSSGSPVETISPGQSIVKTFNNTLGPHWCLFKVTNFIPMSLYEWTFAHSAESGHNLSTSYYMYETRDRDPYYLQFTRPFYPLPAKEVLDKSILPNFMGHWASYEPNTEQSEWYLEMCEGNRWLAILVPDAVEFGSSTGAPPLWGAVNITVTEKAPETLQLGIPQYIYPDSDFPTVFKTTFVVGHTYRIAIKPLNYSSYGYLSFYNSSGHMLFSYPSYQWPTLDDTTIYETYVEKATDVIFVVEAQGDSPVRLVVIDIFYGIEVPFMIIGIAGAAVVGIGVGVLIGKTRYS